MPAIPAAQFEAIGHVEGSAGAGFNPATDAHVSGGTVLRVGVGHYTVTLGEECSFKEVVVIANPHGNANLKATTDDEASLTVKHVFLFDNAGAPADVDFDFVALRFAPPLV